MKSFLYKFDPKREESKKFRNCISSVSLLNLIDKTLAEGNEKEFKIVENKILETIGKPSIIAMLTADCTSQVEEVAKEVVIEEEVAEEQTKEANKERVKESTTEETEVNEKQTFKLQLAYGTKAMQEMGTITGDGEWEEGMEVECVAVPNEGYQFDGWKLSGRGELIKYNPYAITMDGNKTYKAYFSAL